MSTLADAEPATVVFQNTLDIATAGRGSTDITGRVADAVARARIRSGICQVFLRHTSASLILSENADPDVRRDLEAFMSRLVPDGDAIYRHTTEGPDDMSAHVRSVLTASSLGLPVREGRLALGTWQGVFLWEHRHEGSTRHVVVTVLGE